MAKAERPSRTPISGRRNVLKIRGQEPGYTYRVVNDIGDRVKQLEEVGYELVTDKSITVGDKRVAVPSAEGSPHRVSVGTDSYGNPQYGYVMRIKDEWYQENRDSISKAADEAEATMKATAEKNADYGKVTITR